LVFEFGFLGEQKGDKGRFVDFLGKSVRGRAFLSDKAFNGVQEFVIIRGLFSACA
jgi:hypothetical protein